MLARNGDEDATEELLRRSLPVLRFVAHEFHIIGQEPEDVLIVDHIQRMEPLPGRRDVDMHAAAADAARVGKSIAMALNCCVIMLCQLRKQKAPGGEGLGEQSPAGRLYGDRGLSIRRPEVEVRLSSARRSVECPDSVPEVGLIV